MLNVNKPKRQGRKQSRPRRSLAPSLTQLQKLEVSRLITRRLSKNLEDKYVDLNIGTATAVSTTPAITPVNLIAQGTNVSNRVGNVIRCTRYEIKTVTVVGDVTQMMRLCVIWDKQPNGATALDTDIWAQAGQPLSQRNNDKLKRFDILWDEIFTLDTNDSVIVINKVIPINRFTEYNGSTGLISNITTGALLLYQCSDSGAVPHPTQGVASRMFYEDA